MKQAIRFYNEAIGSGATPAQIKKNISTALKGAGFKIKKFQKMSWGYGGIWGGFFTVDGGMVLPFHVKKDGKVSYDAGPKDWIIGNIDYVSVLRNELKKVKQMPDYGQDSIVKVKRTKKIAKEAKFAFKTDPKAAAGVRTSKGPIDIYIEKGKPVIYIRNERLEFKNGKDVREYLDRVYGYWSFFKGKDNNPIKGLKESTAAYEKALQKIAKDKQLSMLSKKDKEKLIQIAKLMKSANEDAKIDERVAMPLGQHLQDAQKDLDYMIKVGPIEDAYDSPKVSLKVIKMARKLLDKVN